MMLSSRYLLCGFVQFLPSRIFRRLLHQDEKSPQQTMLSEICLPKQRIAFCPRLCYQNIFQSDTKRAKPQKNCKRKDVGGE